MDIEYAKIVVVVNDDFRWLEPWCFLCRNGLFCESSPILGFKQDMQIEHDHGIHNVGSDSIEFGAVEILQSPVLAKFFDGVVLDEPPLPVSLIDS